MKPNLLVSLGLLGLAGCPRPTALTERAVLREVATHYHAFFPAGGDTDPSHDTGVLRPRFGIPALARVGEAFEIELLERGGESAVQAILTTRQSGPDDCSETAGANDTEERYPLTLTPLDRRPVADGVAHVRLQARVTTPVPPRDYDLVVCARGDAPVRLPRAVWFRRDDPQTLRIAHLSDLHVRAPALNPPRAVSVLANLREVVDDVNRLAPDIVVVTGDVVDQGYNPALAPIARDELLRLESPLLIIPGNHDHGLGAEAVLAAQPVQGWENFARSFHPELFYRVTLGAWDFVGFDSGASVLSPWAMTRGVTDETVSLIDQALAEARNAGRGVVLFSHAPTRARLFTAGSLDQRGLTGRMRDGVANLERVILMAGQSGQRVLHLSGHTHWSALFDTEPHAGGRRFVLRPAAGAHSCTVDVGTTALITSQSSTQTTFPMLPDGRGHGFAWIELAPATTRVTFHRYGVPREPCETN